jgi:hypothetical protein
MAQANMYIKEQFETMEYGVVLENSSQSLGWIQQYK